MRRLLISSLCLAMLAACETPTLYQPATSPQSVGYSEIRIEPGRYRVSFHGGGGAPAGQVADYALLRAAEIALRDGYDWFRVVAREGDWAPPRSGAAISVGGGGGSFGGHSGGGFGIGTTFDLSPGPALSRSIEILLGRGPTPNAPDAYDAHAVQREIGARAGGRPPS